MTETSKIGIVGAGRIGQALAVRFAAVSRDVMLSNSRGPDTLAAVVGSLGGGVQAGTVEEAARFGDLVAVAIPPRAIHELPPESFAGKIVMDATNYFPGDDRLPELDADETTSSELLASLLPGARVVKAFNAIQFRRLLDHSRPELPPEERLAIPVAGDEPNAKRVVLDLIDEIGFTGVDTGTLAESRRQQPGSVLLRAYAESRRDQTLLTARQVRELLATSDREPG
jgi:8-hydroxy-5-deazaflavin:NADPH oxidoreductase